MSYDPIDVAIGARVRVRRKQLGMSQTDLGNALGVTFQQVQKYERGMNRISGSTLVRTADALKLTMAELTGEADASAGLTPSDWAPLSHPEILETATAMVELSPKDRRAVRDLARALAE